jgi:hypothetical protein
MNKEEATRRAIEQLDSEKETRLGEQKITSVELQSGIWHVKGSQPCEVAGGMIRTDDFDVTVNDRTGVCSVHHFPLN